MKSEELKNNFATTITVWENALKNYTEEQLDAKETQESWSLGQVYEHLTSMTKRILILAEKLSQGNDNSHEEKTTYGIVAFRENNLGAKKIHAPANATNPPQQPKNKEAVIKDLVYLKELFIKVHDIVNKSVYNGKHNHPFLGFLNAMEWLQFTEMHLRHHLEQKKRIDEFLRMNAKLH